MVSRRCCCLEDYTCALATDTFDGTGDDPGEQWLELSGDYDRLNGELVTVTTGVLATTVCHPSGAPLGSFWAEIDLVNIGSGKSYKIRCGHPTESPYYVLVVITGTGATTTVTVTAVGDESDSWEYIWSGRGSQDYLTLRICYAPGLYVSASALDALEDETPDWVTGYLINTEDAAACYEIDSRRLGNFAIIFGDFDNWTYEIHWLEHPANEECQFCDCFCDDGAGGVSGVPKTLELSISNGSGCTTPVGDYPMTQQDIDFENYPYTYTDRNPWPQKYQWWTSFITVDMGGGEEYTFRIGIQCNRNSQNPDITDWRALYQEIIDEEEGWGSIDMFWATEITGADYPSDYPGDSTTLAGSSSQGINVISGNCGAAFYLRLPSLHTDNGKVCEGAFPPFMNLEVSIPA